MSCPSLLPSSSSYTRITWNVVCLCLFRLMLRNHYEHISLHSVFFLTLIYIELTLKIIYLCTGTYRYTYSQLLMTHLGFLYPYIHQPYNLFKKNTKKKTTCVAFSVVPRRAVVLLESVEGTATEALPKSIAWMQAWLLWMFVARSWKSHFP